ncbi:unnamed protein product [Paramecium octaurelia]|uniref:RING-type domain-containing protein n=1 Tax=Paramecium octaurelia TaxID=43137 RepID=A0A8S1VC33_PAROT|nr:unnamed protein product [Paramecium octaurelia]
MLQQYQSYITQTFQQVSQNTTRLIYIYGTQFTQKLGAYHWPSSYATDKQSNQALEFFYKLYLPTSQLLNKSFKMKYTQSISEQDYLTLNNFNFIFLIQSSLFTTIFFSFIKKNYWLLKSKIFRKAHYQESIMKQNLQIDYQSGSSYMKAYEFILRVLREEDEEEHDDDDESSNKAIIILIFLSTGLLVFGIIVCLCKCLYDRIQKKREAQVRQLNESQYQQQIVQIETLCLYNRDLEDCPICLMPIPSILLEITACNHKFHKACLALWLQVDKVCPTCRTRISQ